MAWSLGIKIRDFEAKFKRARPVTLTVGLALMTLGVGLISPNIYEYIFGKLVGYTDYEYTPIIGIILVLIGVIIALFGAYLTRMRNERIEHDKILYESLEQIMSTTKFDEITYSLRNENAIENSNHTILLSYLWNLQNPREFYLTKSIQSSLNEVEATLNELSNAMGRNFFNLHPSIGSQTRRHLRPEWNQDFADEVTPLQMQRYTEQETEKDNLLRAFVEAYNKYQQTVRRNLKISTK